MAAYEALHYDKDQLKEACKCEGLVICKVAAVLSVKCMFNCVYCVFGARWFHRTGNLLVQSSNQLLLMVFKVPQ